MEDETYRFRQLVAEIEGINNICRTCAGPIVPTPRLDFPIPGGTLPFTYCKTCNKYTTRFKKYGEQKSRV
jgi:hypothetical protein